MSAGPASPTGKNSSGSISGARHAARSVQRSLTAFRGSSLPWERGVATATVVSGRAVRDPPADRLLGLIPDSLRQRRRGSCALACSSSCRLPISQSLITSSGTS
jgi:hypothetical protein